MEMSKRTGQGTVAEVLGPDYLQYDIATHSRFDPENIKQQLAALSLEDRAIFEGYAAGFNKRVKEVLADPALMPKEFTDHGFKPSTWQPEDIAMVWVGLIFKSLLFSKFGSIKFRFTHATAKEKVKKKALKSINNYVG